MGKYTVNVWSKHISLIDVAVISVQLIDTEFSTGSLYLKLLTRPIV